MKQIILQQRKECSKKKRERNPAGTMSLQSLQGYDYERLVRAQNNKIKPE